MTESMAISYAKKWYNFHPDESFNSVREVVLAAEKYMRKEAFEDSTNRLCLKLMMHFECRFDEISIEG